MWRHLAPQTHQLWAADGVESARGPAFATGPDMVLKLEAGALWQHALRRGQSPARGRRAHPQGLWEAAHFLT